jgi:hypothetical protein
LASYSVSLIGINGFFLDFQYAIFVTKTVLGEVSGIVREDSLFFETGS